MLIGGSNRVLVGLWWRAEIASTPLEDFLEEK